MLFGFLPNNTLSTIGVAWTLGAIFAFYIIFPFIVFLLYSPKRGIVSFVISLVITYMCQCYFMTERFVTENFVMQNQLLKDDDCACFLVEAIAKKSQNIKWETSVDGQRMGHRLIRRVSLDQFYALVTGQEDAFYQMCMTLPEVIQRVVEAGGNELVPHDTVMEELIAIANENNLENRDLAIAMAIYMLGFSTYSGFTK